MTDRASIQRNVAYQTVEKLRRKYLKGQERVPRNLRSRRSNKGLEEWPLKNPFRRSIGVLPQQLEEILPAGLLSVIAQQEFITVRELLNLNVPPPKESNQSPEANSAYISGAMSLLEECLRQLPQQNYQPILTSMHAPAKQPQENIPSQFVLTHQNIQELCDIGISLPKDHKRLAADEARKRSDSEGFI